MDPSPCPRCGAADCRDPDSKGCSDNCITRHQARIAQLEGQLAQALQHQPRAQLLREALGTMVDLYQGFRIVDQAAIERAVALAQR